jgi:hypothetical protein
MEVAQYFLFQKHTFDYSCCDYNFLDFKKHTCLSFFGFGARLIF